MQLYVVLLWPCCGRVFVAGAACFVYRVDVHRTMNDRFQVMWRQEIGCPSQIAGGVDNTSSPTVPITVVSLVAGGAGGAGAGAGCGSNAGGWHGAAVPIFPIARRAALCRGMLQD